MEAPQAGRPAERASQGRRSSLIRHPLSKQSTSGRRRQTITHAVYDALKAAHTNLNIRKCDTMRRVRNTRALTPATPSRASRYTTCCHTQPQDSTQPPHYTWLTQMRLRCDSHSGRSGLVRRSDSAPILAPTDCSACTQPAMRCSIWCSSLLDIQGGRWTSVSQPSEGGAVCAVLRAVSELVGCMGGWLSTGQATLASDGGGAGVWWGMGRGAAGVVPSCSCTARCAATARLSTAAQMGTVLVRASCDNVTWDFARADDETFAVHGAACTACGLNHVCVGAVLTFWHRTWTLVRQPLGRLSPEMSSLCAWRPL